MEKFVFPQDRRINAGEEYQNYNVREGGMTLRDYYVGKALSNPDITNAAKGGIEGIAWVCVAIADEVCRVLEKYPGVVPRVAKEKLAARALGEDTP